jgi:dienelactone hydrolase
LLGLTGSVSAVEPEYERLTFPSTDNAHTPLTGLLFRPAGQGPFGAVVGIHGCNGLFEKDGTAVEHYVSWGGILRDAGHVVLLVDSLGSRGILSLCSSPAPAGFRSDRQMVSDAYGALAYLQSRGDVRPSAVAIMGWSMGSGTVLWTISSTSISRPAALLNGDFKAAIAFYPAACPGALKAGNWTSAVPLLFQLGAADNYTPPKPCIELMKEARSRGADIEFNLYRGAYHLFDHPDMPAHPFSGIVFRDGSSPMIGTDPVARPAAIERVKTFLRARLN